MKHGDVCINGKMYKRASKAYYERTGKDLIDFNGRKGYPVTVDGKTYPSISDAARAHGVIPATAFSRLRRGWSVGAAVTHPIKCRPGTLYYVTHADSVKSYNKKHYVNIKVA